MTSYTKQILTLTANNIP